MIEGGTVSVSSLQPAQNGDTQDMCLEKECLATSSNMLDLADLSLDPCTDFYRYSCGGWLAQHAIPSAKSTLSIDSQIIRKRNKKLRHTLESLTDDDDHDVDSVERKLKIIYDKCMDVRAINNASVGPLLGAIYKHGGWAITGKFGGTRFISGEVTFYKISTFCILV